jgi:hypothetical protein
MAKKSTAVAKSEEPELKALVPAGERNYFESYGDQVSQKSIVGQLLKFSKGDYLAGENEEEVEPGTQLVANMDQFMVGWIKWVDNKPEQQIMGPIAEGFQPPRRNTLGDDDKTQWEEDTQGRPRDPWQFSNYVIMKEVGKPGNAENLYTFATSSKGGLNALGEVCKVYGKMMRTNGDQWPIVELGVDSYNHSNKEFGRIKVPVLKVVGWEDKAMFAEGAAKPAAKKRAAK